MPDLLVTGTDTGIGKTVIAAALITAMRARGERAIGFKPVETGIVPGELSDSEVLRAASGEDEPLAVPLLQLAEPLAPAVAAERAAVLISPSVVEDRVRLLKARGYSVVVEGAGGVMVPLAWNANAGSYYTVLDLAQRFGLEAVIVARAGLGTLNHATMTAAMLRGRNIRIRAIVLNGRAAVSDLAEQTNPAVLTRMLPDILVLEVPHHVGPDTIAAVTPIVDRLIA